MSRDDDDNTVYGSVNVYVIMYDVCTAGHGTREWSCCVVGASVRSVGAMDFGIVCFVSFLFQHK